MKTNKLIWTLGWITMGSLAALQGCGGDDDDGGDGSSSGGEAGDGAGGSTGGSTTGGRGGSTGGSTQGGSGGSTGGSTQGGAGGAPGGMGGDPGVGGEGGGGAEDRLTVCTEYCQIYIADKNCDEATSDTYGDEPTCRDVCTNADWPLGDRMDASGDSVHCRLTHAGLANAMNAPDEVHCGHASENPTGVCVD